MKFIMDIIAYPLGLIIWALYSFIPNYGIAIILFTFITKILLFPLSIHQHKATLSRIRLQPKLADLKAKYGKNPQKYNEEMMNLYKKEGINPTAGCGSSLVQLPILFGMLGVVYSPLKYLLKIPDELINKGLEIASKLLNTDILSKAYNGKEYILINTVKENPNAFKSLGEDIIRKISELHFNFCGLDLSQTPSIPHYISDLNWLLLIPILSGITSFLFSLYSMKNQTVSLDEASKQAAQSMKFMLWIAPIMSVGISFKLPAGAGLYWIFSNIFSIIQTKILYKKYNPTEIIAKAQEEMEIKKEQERLARIEAKKNPKKDEDGIHEGMSEKERNKIKLANARKRDAEKYGDSDIK